MSSYKIGGLSRWWKYTCLCKDYARRIEICMHGMYISLNRGQCWDASQHFPVSLCRCHCISIRVLENTSLRFYPPHLSVTRMCKYWQMSSAKTLGNALSFLQVHVGMLPCRNINLLQKQYKTKSRWMFYENKGLTHPRVIERIIYNYWLGEFNIVQYSRSDQPFGHVNLPWRVRIEPESGPMLTH